MSTHISVAKVIEKLPSRFVAANAKDVTATFQFVLEDEQDFYISIADEKCNIGEGEHPDPNLTLIMDAETMVEVITGKKDGMSAFMSGKLRAEGNVILATQLGKLFSREKQT
jgi:putative sterol carrier protein